MRSIKAIGHWVATRFQVLDFLASEAASLARRPVVVGTLALGFPPTLAIIVGLWDALRDLVSSTMRRRSEGLLRSSR
jgi:hypothetical protein